MNKFNFETNSKNDLEINLSPEILADLNDAIRSCQIRAIIEYENSDAKRQQDLEREIKAELNFILKEMGLNIR